MSRNRDARKFLLLDGFPEIMPPGCLRGRRSGAAVSFRTENWRHLLIGLWADKEEE